MYPKGRKIKGNGKAYSDFQDDPNASPEFTVIFGTFKQCK